VSPAVSCWLIIRFEQKAYFDFFFSCFAAFFSFIVFSGFFLSLFFESRPLLMLLSVIGSVVECDALKV
jgi:hypothetical protein